MSRALVLVVLLGACGQLNRVNTGAMLVADATLAADWHQTHWMTKHYAEGYAELDVDHARAVATVRVPCAQVLGLRLVGRPLIPERVRVVAESRIMRCKAGHEHDTLTADHTARAWLVLECIGETVLEAETIDGVTYNYERTEMRNCPCGTTLGMTFDIAGKRIV